MLSRAVGSRPTKVLGNRSMLTTLHTSHLGQNSKAPSLELGIQRQLSSLCGISLVAWSVVQRNPRGRGVCVHASSIPKRGVSSSQPSNREVNHQHPTLQEKCQHGHIVAFSAPRCQSFSRLSVVVWLSGANAGDSPDAVNSRRSAGWQQTA